jgi:hypothetical protein
VVIGLLLSNQCNPVKEREVIRTDTIYGDSVPYIVYQGIPQPYAVHHWHTDSFTRIDTQKVFIEHFASNEYSDTLKNDTSALIVLNEVIERNKIASRELIFQNRRATAINHIYPEKVNRLHLGGHVGLNVVGVELGYTRKENTLRLGYSSQGVYLGYNRVIKAW